MSDNQKPNILFIFPDQWRGDALSILGNPLAETPFLDRLAAQGTLFRNTYANAPTCIPARACLITGQTPDTAGRLAYRDHVPWPYKQTMMTLLRNNGYQTMLSGKSHFHPPRAHLGFEQIELYDNQRHYHGFTSDYDNWIRDKTNGLIEDTAQQLDSNSQLVQPWTHDQQLHPTSWTVTKGIEMLERRDPTRPFFLNLAFHRPHPPYDPPLAYLERMADVALPQIPIGDWAGIYDKPESRIDPSSGNIPEKLLDRARRAYYAQINFIDFQIGRMLRHLQLNGILNNTMIIFSSDHGEQLGEHRLYRKSSPLEGSAKVPLIVKMPGGYSLPEGQERDEPVALHDIMPSVLEAADIDIPAGVEGSSILPLVKGENISWRSHIHCEHADGFAPGGWQCVTDGKQKYIWCVTSGNEYFFDLEQDPHEMHNLASAPERQQDMESWRQRLIAEIKHRKEDAMTDGKKLVPARQLPSHRDWLEQ